MRNSDRAAHCDLLRTPEMKTEFSRVTNIVFTRTGSVGLRSLSDFSRVTNIILLSY